MRKFNMKITFILPGSSRHPVGGFKMVFEYANRFAARGNEVTIVFNCLKGAQRHKKVPGILREICYKLIIWYYPKWFVLNPKVHKVCAYTGTNNREIPDADFVCATAVGTADDVANLSINKGKKLYFIQDFENWGGWTDEAVKKTYHLGMTNIVIAKWLEKIVKDSGADCVLIPNGIDFEVFNIDIPIASREGHTISMLYHKQEHKGAKYGIEALKRLKERYPDLEATLFGVPQRPEDLPQWIHYIQNATQPQLRQVYNQSKIYLCPSIKEGFGLTGAEAMACGAAYVASDYGGVHEYTTDGRNVLLSAPKDVDGLVEHVAYLFDHDDKRIALAKQGYEDIRSLDWNKSVDKFENVMKSL